MAIITISEPNPLEGCKDIEIKLQKSPKELYEEFWKDIVETDEKLDINKIMNELFDYYYLIDKCEKIFDYITGGQVSKANTSHHVIISLYEDNVNLLVEEGIKDFLEANDGIILPEIE